MCRGMLKSALALIDDYDHHEILRYALTAGPIAIIVLRLPDRQEGAEELPEARLRKDISLDFVDENRESKEDMATVLACPSDAVYTRRFERSRLTLSVRLRTFEARRLKSPWRSSFSLPLLASKEPVDI